VPKILKTNNFQKTIPPILLKSLIILLFLLSTLPFHSGQVVAQQPTDHAIFLPLVYKNTSGVCPNSTEQWLCLFNHYRQIAGLNPVTHNANYNYGLSRHINYMLLNPLSDMHKEEPGKPGYTAEGAEAAGQSNMIKLIGGTNLTVEDTINLWLLTERHRYHMLHPDLIQSGYNFNCDSKNCFSGLNVLQGLNSQNEVQNVVYPANNQVNVPPIRYPITWGFYIPWVSPLDDSKEVRFVSAAIYNENNQKISYSIKEPNHSDNACDYFNQIILTPKNDLLPNHTYRVEMTVSHQGQSYSKIWRFTTGP